jgi:2-(1,2-epoxy-1,2-dihydrophenyl)acetyl-CoA isomerase
VSNTANEHLLFEIDDRIATLTLNRPDRLNALSDGMIVAAIERLERCAVDPEVGAVVVTGAGRAFCSGGDVSSMGEGAGGFELEPAIDGLRSSHRLAWQLSSMPKVTIAAINGAAVGAGLGLALACDLRLAVRGAKLMTAFARVGLSGDFGTTWGLARLVGPARAKELLILGDALVAEEAERIGLVNRVFEEAAFAAEVRSLARRIAHGPGVSYRYIKENVNLAMTSDYRTMLEREPLTHLRCALTEDHREGVRAFLQKREPDFKGR